MGSEPPWLDDQYPGGLETGSITLNYARYFGAWRRIVALLQSRAVLRHGVVANCRD